MKKYCIAACCFVFAIWVGNLWFAFEVFCTPEERGTFGDLFGMANSLFSGLAFVGLIVTLLMQKQELELQRREIKESREAQQLSANSTKVIAEITFLSAKINALRESHRTLVQLSDKLSLLTSHDARQDKKTIDEKVRNCEGQIEALIEKIVTKEIE